MTINLRSVMLASAFAITVAGAIAGLTFRGETKEASRDETCAHAAWPMIPAGCLEGGQGHDVRFVSTDHLPVDAMQERFALAFQ